MVFGSGHTREDRKLLDEFSLKPQKKSHNVRTHVTRSRDVSYDVSYDVSHEVTV